MTSGTGAGETESPYRVLRVLGRRSQHAWAALRGSGELVVLQRFARRPPGGTEGASAEGVPYVSADAMETLVRDAHALAKNWHPNIARVRHVDVVGDELFIASELVDGVTLTELIELARAKHATGGEDVFTHSLVARIVVDVLGGLHGLHGLRDDVGTRFEAFHGELCPANVVIGKDGVARIAHVFRPRPVKISTGSEGIGYAAPEVLASEPQDGRADIYSVGAILWEGLTGRRLFEDEDPARLAHRQRAEQIASPELSEDSGFARLGEVATRALAVDPAARFRTASEMASAIRRVVARRLAPGSAVAQTVVDLASERIRTRRLELERSGPPPEPISTEDLEAALPRDPKAVPSLPPATVPSSERRLPIALPSARSSGSPVARVPSAPSSDRILGAGAAARVFAPRPGAKPPREEPAPRAPDPPPPIEPPPSEPPGEVTTIEAAPPSFDPIDAAPYDAPEASADPSAEPFPSVPDWSSSGTPFAASFAPAHAAPRKRVLPIAIAAGAGATVLVAAVIGFATSGSATPEASTVRSASVLTASAAPEPAAASEPAAAATEPAEAPPEEPDEPQPVVAATAKPAPVKPRAVKAPVTKTIKAKTTTTKTSPRRTAAPKKPSAKKPSWDPTGI